MLQKNARGNLIRTLEDWSDRGQQVGYKQAVPFVHVPRELLAQWDQYRRLLHERRDWFIQSLTAPEIAAMAGFDAVVEAFVCDEQLADVPEVFAHPEWIRLMAGAGDLLAVLKSRA
jgi:hypothetical protein